MVVSIAVSWEVISALGDDTRVALGKFANDGVKAGIDF